MPYQPSLKSKTISGMIWTFADLLSNQGLQFIIQVILARLLVPKDFGVMGMITVFIAVSQSFIDSGFTNALIREKDPSQEDYSTVFFFNLFMSIVMYILLFFSANAISVFFKEPQLIQILRVLALVLIINAFGITQRTMLTKKIDFKTQTRINIIASILSGLVAIGFAYRGFGVWSLVVRTLSMQFVQALLFSVSNKWMPSMVFSMSSFKKLFGFGWKLLISGIINTLFQNIYYLVIGRGFSANELGYYTNASKFRDTTSKSITTSVQKVSYPVLSSIQEDDNKLKLGYKKIIKNSVFITFPMMVGLAAVADPLFRLLFGIKWIPSITYFQILCFAGMLFPLHAINLNILQVKGRSDLFLGLEILKKVISLSLIAIILFLKLGIIGLLWMSVVDSFISYFINSYFSAKLLNYSTIDQIVDITPIFMVTAAMGLLVYIVGLMIPAGNLVKLLIQVAIGVITYIGLSKPAKIEELNTVIGTLATVFNKLVRNK